MGILNRLGQGAAKRAVGMVSMWKPPKSSGGTNISTVEAIYSAGVLILMLVLLAVLKGDGLGSALVLGGALVGLSNAIRQITIPALYGPFAQWFHWPSFEDALRQELAAREGKEVPVQPVQAAGAQPAAVQPAVIANPEPQAEPEAADDIKKALRLFMGLAQEERRTRALKLLAFVKEKGETSPVLAIVDTTEDPDTKAQLAEASLLTLAKQRQIA